MEEVKAHMKDVVEVVKALRFDSLAPYDTQLTNVKVEGSLVAGYIQAARLDDRLDVILIATEKEKNEAFILKRLSNHDKMLRFYGIFK
jgi:mRNA-degrading endonuclease YafQ of YafQ-DinJ toxin-antitoxin module